MARQALLSAPEDWVVIFDISQDSRNFELLIDTGTEPSLFLLRRDVDAAVRLDHRGVILHCLCNDFWEEGL